MMPADEFLEILPRRWARALLWITLLLTASLLAWACVARVDMTVSGRGTLVKSQPPGWVRPGESGKVAEVWVQPGDTVHSGDRLFAVQSHVVTAPEDGLVSQVRVSPGVSVEADEVTVSLASSSDPYVFEALIPNRDIGKVQPGMAAAVHLDAFPVERFGPLPATVATLSPSFDANNAYRVRCTLGRQSIDANRPLLPALTGTVDLILGDVPLIDLILKPLQ